MKWSDIVDKKTWHESPWQLLFFTCITLSTYSIISYITRIMKSEEHQWMCLHAENCMGKNFGMAPPLFHSIWYLKPQWDIPFFNIYIKWKSGGAIRKVIPAWFHNFLPSCTHWQMIEPNFQSKVCYFMVDNKKHAHCHDCVWQSALYHTNSVIENISSWFNGL